MTLDEFSLLTRIAAAVVWTMLMVRVLGGYKAGYTIGGTFLRRSLIVTTLVATLWGSVLRGATIVGYLPSDVTAFIFTGTVCWAFIAGVTLLTTDPV